MGPRSGVGMPSRTLFLSSHMKRMKYSQSVMSNCEACLVSQLTGVSVRGGGIVRVSGRRKEMVNEHCYRESEVDVGK